MPRRSTVVLALALLGLTAVTFVVRSSVRRGNPDVAYRTKCLRHLRSLGQAILMYANENRGRFPPDLHTLRVSHAIGPEIFCCPALYDAHANVADPDHSDYVYLDWSTLTRGRDWETNPYPVLYDRTLAHHGVPAVNVLFSDGSVHWDEGATRLKEFATIHPDAKIPLPR